MERPSDEFDDSSLPDSPAEDQADAVPSEATWSSDAAAELVPDEAPIEEPEDLASSAFDGGEGEENVEIEETVGEAPDEAVDAEEISETPEEAPSGDVPPELVAAVDEAFQDAEVSLDEESEDDAALLDWQPGQWFVVHTYAGYENKVKTNLESRIVSMNMEEKIHEVVIPTEDVMEVKSGKKQVVQKKVFPGYLLVRMDLDDDSWYVVRNTPGVTGFVGSGTKPIPLSDKEVDRVLQRKGPEERPKPRLEFSAGDGVRVVTGPFANFQGVISDIDVDRSKLKVLVNIFGRETPVELGFDQVAKI